LGDGDIQAAKRYCMVTWAADRFKRYEALE